ncbi:MAG: carbohydrate ABC transporter permease [Eubacteriales bacterium]|nr:carbohydrate ABC transporter permease [Eubacteriales bacterium]
MGGKKVSAHKMNGDKVFDVVNYALLTLVVLIVLYPLIFVVSASISDPILVNSGEVWLLPKGITLEGYKSVLEYEMIWVGYANTIFYTIVGTAINLSLTLLTAYALSRKDLIGRNVFTMFFAFTMYFSGGLIPTYITVKNLGLLDTRAVMLVLGAISMYNVIITRTYFSNNIPFELQEAGFLDGCSDAGLFIRVILPLSLPIIAVMALYYAVGHWNSYFNAMIYLTDRNKMTLQIFLREVLLLNQLADMMGSADTDEMLRIAERQKMAMIMKYCLIVVSTAPILCVYPFLQRYFVKGIMVGAVKG